MSTITAQLGVASESVAAPTISVATYAAGPPASLAMTFATPHGLVAHQSWVTLTGFTPSGYNGLRVPVVSVGSSTIATALLPSAIGVVTVIGTATIQVPGTAATVTRFYIPTKAAITRKDYPRLTSEGIRAGTRTTSKSDVVPYKSGVGGSLEFAVRDKGFGFWFQRLMGGTVVTTALGGAPAAYEHEWQLGNLNGDTFTCQVNRPFRTGIDRPSTFTGCKVSKATIKQARNGLLTMMCEVVGIDENDAIAMAVASYSSGAEPNAFCGAQLTVATVAVPCLSWELTIDNGLEKDTSRMRADCAQMEHLHDDLTDVKWKAEVDWRDYTFRNLYSSLVTTGIKAALVMSSEWPVAISGANKPKVTLTMPSAVFNGDDPTIDKVELLTQKLEGFGTDPEDGTNTALKLEYVTADATP